MHHCLQPVLFAAIVGVAASLTAQDTTRPAGGGLAERFKQLDRIGFEEATRLELEWFTKHLKKQP
jgi:hypothetical protein